MSLDSKINLKVEGLQLLAFKLSKLVGIPRGVMIPLVAKYALKIQNGARRAVRVDLGVTRASIITAFIGDGLTAEIGSNQKAAVYLEEGTRPHMPPVEALKGWCERHGMAGAEWAVARAIKRRGTRARPFLEPAFKEEAPEFVKEASAELKTVLENY